LSSTYQHVKSGALRALAVGSETRAPLLPDVPTLSETIPGFASTVWYGVVAPPKTPPAIVAKVSGWVSEIMKQPEMVARLQAINIVPIGSNPAEMGRFVQAELDRWGSVVRAAKISVE
jgi:tripartite-type tricarboxylate transporter receptor subunit TctC